MLVPQIYGQNQYSALFPPTYADPTANKIYVQTEQPASNKKSKSKKKQNRRGAAGSGEAPSSSKRRKNSIGEE